MKVKETFYYKEDEALNSKVFNFIQENLQQYGFWSPKCKKSYKIEITIEELN